MRFWKARYVRPGTTIGIVVATYDQPLLVTLGSLQAQTFSGFSCLAVHDGPGSSLFDEARRIFGADPRFVFLETPRRENVFGHNCRRFGFNWFLSQPSVPYLLCTTNGDNYATPVFLEMLAHSIQTSGKHWAICDMVHSHRQWRPLEVSCQRKHIDAASFMITSDVVRNVVWDSNAFAADWDFCSRVLEKYGEPVKVPHTLVVHN